MATRPIVNNLPPAPLPTDSIEDFDSKAFDHVAALDQFVGEVNDVAEYVNSEAVRAESTMTYIDGRANAAATSATNAGNSANQSLNEANRAKGEADRSKELRVQSETLYTMTSEAASEALEHVSSLALMQRQIGSIDWVIPSGYNALVIGDLNVNPGVTVTGVGSATLRGI